MKTGLLSILVGFMLAGQALAQEDYTGPIIDMHLHAQDAIWADRRLCFPKPCEGEPTIASSPEQVRDMTITAMRQNKIVLGFLSDQPANLDKWAAVASELFLISPLIDKPAEIDIKSLRRDYSTGKYHGVGEITTQYWGYAPSDPAVDPFFALAEDFDVPAHIHTLGIGAPTPTFRVANGDPRLLETVLTRHPKLRLFVENCGFPFADEMTAMMYQYPQLYCEVSTILHLTPRARALAYLQELMDNGLGKRIMYGSDQMIWPEVIPEVIAAIQSADFLTTEEKADIFYNNAARFLRLSDEEISGHRASIAR